MMQPCPEKGANEIRIIDAFLDAGAAILSITKHKTDKTGRNPAIR